ncbi:MAG TPA: metallophosphoesterase [Chthonomonadaceae bacterium]|nr:metallophosphoesterase [Chthonomonadaceae bacterium]
MKGTVWGLLGLLLLPRLCLADSTRPLLPLPGSAGSRPSAQASDPDHFTFVISGDNRSTGRGVPQPPTAGQIFAEIHLLRPAFVLWTGDSIYGSEEPVEEAGAEYDAFLGQAARAATPVFCAPGNHEIYDRSEMETLYQSRMGRLYGSFDYGHTHLIALDTEEIGRHGGIGPKQMEWLKQDLAANRQAKNIVVFMHHPLFPKDAKEGFADSANRDALHRLFVASDVRAVFCGHEHLLYHSTQDGIPYWVSGGAGAPIDAPADEGGFQHYLLCEVNDSEISVRVLQPWRLFTSVEAGASGGFTSALLSNYDDCDLPLTIDLPVRATTAASGLSASCSYKGKTRPLAITMAPSSQPDTTTLRVIVPKARSARITFQPVSAP